jgi:uncharacterized SAM-binding protein YcdF (DUF218 family)
MISLVTLRARLAGLALGALCGILAKDLGLRSVVSYWGVFSPIVVAFALLGAAIWPTRARALVELTAGGLAALWLLVAFSPLCLWLARPLVRADALRPADAIFVLSSNVQVDDDPSPSALARATRGLELFGAGLAPWLYLSELPPPAGSFRRYLRESARRIGLPHPEAILDVGLVGNTRDEAVRVAALFRDKGWRRLLLVTSPTHTRRAAAAFERAGVPEVVAVPAVETWYDVERLRRSDERIESFGASVHEWIGLYVYGRRGWI